MRWAVGLGLVACIAFARPGVPFAVTPETEGGTAIVAPDGSNTSAATPLPVAEPNPEASAAPVEAGPPDPYPFFGVTVERLAGTQPLPIAARTGETWTEAVLTRLTIEPGGRFDYPVGVPILVYVEGGTLTLERVGRGVTLTSAPEAVAPGERPRRMHPGQATITRGEGGTTTRQYVDKLAEGANATLEAGGSAYTKRGDLSVLRNASGEPVVLLLLAFPSYERSGVSREDVMRVAADSPPSAATATATATATAAPTP